MTNIKIVGLLGFVAMGAAISGSAHARERVFVPVPSEGQDVQYIDGEQYLFGTNDGATLAISIEARDKKTGWAKLYVGNEGSHAFNVGDTSVTASSGGTPLVVATYTDRIREQKRKQMWAGVATGLAAASNNFSAANAGYSQTSGTYNSRTTASAYGSGGYAHGTATTNGSFSGTTYNAYDAQRAQNDANARNQTLFAQARANTASEQQNLQDRALKMNTVTPGESIYGDVQFALPRRSDVSPVEFTLTVDLNGGPVQFLFRESP